MPARPRRILIFGGSFDPPHLAHAALPPLAAHQLDCDEILYIPARVSPHKQDAPPVDSEHRIAMLTLALADVPEARILTLELDRTGASFTIDTLRDLRSQYPADVEFVLLIGADQALHFHDWKDWREILNIAEPAVMLRPPWTPQRFAAELENTYDDAEARVWADRVLRLPLMDVDSSALREKLLHGRSPDGMIDPAVRSYIDSERLYRSASLRP